MPYGTILEATKTWVLDRAAQSGITPDQLGLDAPAPSCGLEGHEMDEDCDCESVEIPDDLYQISVIFGGALEEEFLVRTMYEVNIADWIAEYNTFVCQLGVSAGKTAEDWEVTVYNYAHSSGEATVRYRVTDES